VPAYVDDPSSVSSADSETRLIYIVEHFVCTRGGVRFPALDRRTVHYQRGRAEVLMRDQLEVLPSMPDSKYQGMINQDVRPAALKAAKHYKSNVVAPCSAHGRGESCPFGSTCDGTRTAMIRLSRRVSSCCSACGKSPVSPEEFEMSVAEHGQYVAVRFRSVQWMKLPVLCYDRMIFVAFSRDQTSNIQHPRFLSCSNALPLERIWLR
jgi:hypothetical protein